MTEPSTPQMNVPDPKEVAKTMATVAEKSQRIIQDYLDRHKNGAGKNFNVLDPGVVGHTFMELTKRLMTDPTKLWEAQMAMWQDVRHPAFRAALSNAR